MLGSWRGFNHVTRNIVPLARHANSQSGGLFILCSRTFAPNEPLDRWAQGISIDDRWGNPDQILAPDAEYIYLAARRVSRRHAMEGLVFVILTIVDRAGPVTAAIWPRNFYRGKSIYYCGLLSTSSETVAKIGL